MSFSESPRHVTGRRYSAAVYRRRRLAVFSGALVVLTLITFLGLVLGLPLPSATAEITQATTVAGEPASVVLPSFGSTSVSAQGFGTIVATGSTDSLPIASMTKVITAIMVLKKHPLTGDESGPTITFSQVDVDLINDVKALNGNYSDVSPGDTTTERDALEVMLMKSANNIASSLAVWAYGSMDEYRAATASWLADQGLIGTTIVDASGLDPATVSTTSDMVEIGTIAMSDPVLASIVGTTHASLPLFGEVKNGNLLLGTDGINGIKTGTTDEAGSCLLYSATFPVSGIPVSLVGVTMGGPPLQADLQPAVAELVSSIEAGFHAVTLSDPAVPVATVTTMWGTSSDVVPRDSTVRVLWSDTKAEISTQLSEVRGGRKGDTVGKLTIKANGETMTTPLVLTADLGDPGPFWRFSHVASLFG